MDYANTTQDPDVMLERLRKEEVTNMITSMTKALEKELLWSEEELNKKSKMKNEGAGLLILGIGVLALGIANHFLLHIIYESDGLWMAVTAGCVLLGIVLAGFGGKLITKTGASVAEMTAKDSGYSVGEIQEFYRECRQPDSLLLSLTLRPTKEKDFDKELAASAWKAFPGCYADCGCGGDLV